jgi:hypothetical protein
MKTLSVLVSYLNGSFTGELNTCGTAESKEHLGKIFQKYKKGKDLYTPSATS